MVGLSVQCCSATFLSWCNDAQQGEAAAQRQSWAEAEGFFLRAKQPDLALAMYRRARLWEAALRIAEDYLPAKVSYC